MVPFPFSLKSLHFNLEEHPECKIIDMMRMFRNEVGFVEFPIERFGKLNLCQNLIWVNGLMLWIHTLRFHGYQFVLRKTHRFT